MEPKLTVNIFICKCRFRFRFRFPKYLKSGFQQGSGSETFAFLILFGFLTNLRARETRRKFLIPLFYSLKNTRTNSMRTNRHRPLLHNDLITISDVFRWTIRIVPNKSRANKTKRGMRRSTAIVKITDPQFRLVGGQTNFVPKSFLFVITPIVSEHNKSSLRLILKLDT